MRDKLRALKKYVVSDLVFFIALLLIPAGGILAYFTMVTDENNEFRVRHLETQLEDEFEEPENFSAGSTYDKKVSVRNMGSVPCYVRVFAEIKQPSARTVIEVNYNSEDWKKDGYYWYYNDVLEAGESTSPLFTQLDVSGDVVDFEMICYQEAVGAEENTDAVTAFE